MTTEIKMLGCSILLGLAYVTVASVLCSQQRGLRWNAGNRDGEAKPLTPIAARAARANANFLETFGFFAAAVLGVVALKHDTPQTALGAELYFWARLTYLPVYVIGIPYLRTAVWVIAFWGMLQIIEALF
jgi:uncharacterized MAPEG superfamily protein